MQVSNLSSLQDQLISAKSEHDALKQELALQVSNFSSLQDHLTSAKSERDALKQELALQVSNLSSLQDQLTSTKSERDTLEQELALQVSNLSSLQDQLTSAKSERDALKQELAMPIAELSSSQDQLSFEKCLADGFKQELARRRAELSSTQDQLFSANTENTTMRNDHVQLNLSLNTMKAERGALKETLATQAAQLSYLDDQLSSANTANVTGTTLLSVLRKRVHAQVDEIQRARDELRRAEDDLIVMRTEKAESEMPIQALRAEVADLKLQNCSLQLRNLNLGQAADGGECGAPGPSSRNHTYGFRHPVPGSSPSTNPVPGTSHVVSQQFSPSPAGFPHVFQEFDEEILRLCEERERVLKNIQRLITCGVCTDQHPEDNVTLLDPCGHKLCKGCVRGYIGTKLEERRFPVLCPLCMVGERQGDPSST